MTEPQSLKTHLITELRDLLDAEQQLLRVLPDFAQRATTPALRTAFEQHLRETEAQIDRLRKAFEELGESPRAKRCEGMHGLIREGNAVVSAAPGGALRDALMITSAQKIEHYEMASYGTARTYAQVLGEPRVARLLQDTLEEEKKADAKLTEIAERKINEQAAEEWHHVTEGLLLQTAAFAGKAVGIGARTIKRAAGAVGLAQRTGSGNASTAAVPQITSSLNRAADSAGEAATESAGRAGSRTRRATEGGRQASRQQATTRKPSRTRSKQSANKHPRSRGR
jgi:ferritin-like metal-binding protein YciE